MPPRLIDRSVVSAPRLRTKAASWVGSVALHLPLFWLLQGTETAPPPVPPEQAPVELHLISSEQVQALLSGQAVPSPAPKAEASKGKAQKALKKVWQRLESMGSWGSESSFAVQPPTKSPGGLRNTTTDTSAPMPDNWKPKATPPKSKPRPGSTGLGLAGIEASGGLGSLSAASPWHVNEPASGGQAIRSGPGLKGATAGIRGGGDIGGGDWGASEKGSENTKDIVGSEGGGEGAGQHAFELRGQLTGRRILSSPLPPYPSWAKEQGLEADVTVYFVVDPNGYVRGDSHVKRTSGDPRLDQIVLQTIRSWRFAALGSGAKRGDQWGLVTFHFRLHG